MSDYDVTINLEENVAAAGLVLTRDQMFVLDDIGEAVGDRYAAMSPLNR